MAHQWFGDLVTMRWWDDIWLNEGFATWMANRPLQAWKPEWNIAVDEELETQKALTLDALQSTHAIRSAVSTPAEIDAAFDPISYEKGAAVLRMIEHYVGADAFRTGINTYLQAHAYGNATSEDFWNAIAAASGKPVDRILPTFITQVGAPLVDVSSLTCSGGPTMSTRATLSQERFGIDATVRSRGAWQVPVCIKGGTTAQSGESCQVLSPQPQTLDVARGCAPWVFVNAGAQGYYRTAYPPALLRMLAPDLSTALTPPERLSLVADEWAMVSSGRHTAADYLALAASFSRESSSGVLSEVVDRLAFIRQYLTNDASRPRFEAFARAMLRPIFERVGLSTAPSDPDDRRALRAVVVAAIGTTGNAADIAAQARAALDRSLTGGPSLDPTLAPSIVSIAAAHGDTALYDHLLAAAARAGSPGERSLYLDATSDFRDPAVLKRALQRALTPEVRTQDTALYLAPFFDNPIGRPLAWAFVKSNWTALAPKMSVFGGDVALMEGLASFCDEGSREDIKAFFATHKLSDSARPLTQTLERITSCVDLKARQTGPVSGWLANQ
jgi:aminopeptidase N